MFSLSYFNSTEHIKDVNCRLHGDPVNAPLIYNDITIKNRDRPGIGGAMYGAILGDIIGSPFEFDRGDKTKDFRLFTKGCQFTDDSVMTVAVAEALMEAGPDAAKKEIEDAVTVHMRQWGRKYPYAGYGSRFFDWLKATSPRPYNSFGNGSAMRVSAAGWLYPTLERTRQVAVYTAEVSHNHPEGIKGAEATASAIFLARNGATKDEIKKYIAEEFHYDLNRTLEDIRSTYHHVESCQQTVPEAVIAFLAAEDFEDALRNAVSLGGDTDTLAAITGSIAEDYFGSPAVLKAECRKRITDDMMSVVEKFDGILGRNNVHWDERMTFNEAVETAINRFYERPDKDSLIFLASVLCSVMKNEGCGLVPFVVTGSEMFPDLDVNNVKEGDCFTLDHDVRMRMDTVSDGNGEEWFYIFTSEEEIHRQAVPDVVMQISFADMLEAALRSDKVAGIVINPFGHYFKLDKKLIELIQKDFSENWKEQ